MNWGELCPVPTPPLRHPPVLGREVFVAPLRHCPRTVPGAARGRSAVRGAAPRAPSPAARRRNLGGRVAARYRAGPGAAEGRTEGGGSAARAGLWRLRRPQPARTGWAARRPAGPGRPLRKLFIPQLYLQLLHHGRYFRRYSGEMLPLPVNKRSRFWQY